MKDEGFVHSNDDDLKAGKWTMPGIRHIPEKLGEELMDTFCPGCEFGPMHSPHNKLGKYCSGPRHRRVKDNFFTRFMEVLTGRP
jgi:hypothetical protein